MKLKSYLDQETNNNTVELVQSEILFSANINFGFTKYYVFPTGEKQI